ncbi:MAG: hypothetical protein R6W75_06565 [Smithellaceae bacterium]
MEAEYDSERTLREFYETARISFITKMKSEDDERSNLKFKIAAFVIYELSHSTPSWFQGHFLSNIAPGVHPTDIADKAIAEAENLFHNSVAAYLIKLESDVNYVKSIFSRFTDEGEKKNYWKPIVADAFLIVGIYMAPSSGAWINQTVTGAKKTRKAPRPAYPYQAFGFC